MHLISVGKPTVEPDEWKKFGDPVTGSRWFRGVPAVEVRAGEVVWACPTAECNGSMEFNGSAWPTGSYGYHHTCSECGFAAAIHGARFGHNEDE